MKMTSWRLAAGATAVLASALLPACKSVDVPKVPGITPYRMVIQQGNFISQEMVAQLKPGMTKEQVRFVLGTPLVTDIFHADRWDYVFYREMPNGKREQRNLSVVFENSKLARVLGDLMPSEGAVQSSGFEAQIKPQVKPKPEPKVDAKPAPEAVQAVPAASSAPPGQNWGTTSFETKTEAAPAPTPEPADAAEVKKEPSFLDRLREKIGL